MKPNPAESAVRERMAPGALSRDGFLGTDARPLEDIISADMDALADAGVPREALAELLEDIHERADANQEAPLSLYGGAVTAQATEVRGRIPCPFGDGHLAHKAVIDIRGDGIELRVTPLGIHMLRDHGFLQGRGAEFRVAPEQLLRLWRCVRGKGSVPSE